MRLKNGFSAVQGKWQKINSAISILPTSHPRALPSTSGKMFCLQSLEECPLAKKIVALGTKCDVDLQEAAEMTKHKVRKRIHSAQRDLWTAQKEATMQRVAWLEENAQIIAKAADEVDWENKMKDMAALAHERGVDRNMTNAIRGFQRSLDQIEVPLRVWHYSDYGKEIYCYDKGVFEAHAA